MTRDRQLVRDVSHRWPDATVAVQVGGPVVATDGGEHKDESATATGGTERERLREKAQMERDIRDHNRRVREIDECDVCGDEVPEEDFSEKYAAAAGALTGPFCSSECYWGWMNS